MRRFNFYNYVAQLHPINGLPNEVKLEHFMTESSVTNKFGIYIKSLFFVREVIKFLKASF